jgi:hypothetical protein
VLPPLSAASLSASIIRRWCTISSSWDRLLHPPASWSGN